MNYSLGFWNRIADNYAKRPVADEAVYKKKLTIMSDLLKPNMQVLEFGCGTGSTAVIQADNVAHYTAIDVSPKMIEIANSKKKPGTLTNLDFKVSAIEEYQVENSTFDAILAMSILHLLDNRPKVIAKAYQLLQPGGYFISSTTCIKDVAPIFAMIAPIGAFFKIIPKVENLSYQELESSITTAGFKIRHKWIPTGKSKAIFIVAQKPQE